MAVQLSNNVKNTQFQGITVRFLKHPLPQFDWFHNVLNSHYILRTPDNIFASLFVDNSREALRDTSVDLLRKWWVLEIVGKSSVKTAVEKGRCLEQLKLLPFASLYRNGESVPVLDANDFKEAMERQVDVGRQNAHVLGYSDEQKWFIVLVDIAKLFPTDQNITGLNWEDFKTDIDRTAVVNTENHLKAIATNTKNLATNSATAAHSATSKVEYLDYTQLPDDVKEVYLRKVDGGRIIKDDIKKFLNEFTEDANGVKQRLNFIEFPKAKWTYIIYMDGTYFRCLGHQQNFKYLSVRFKKSLQPMPEWNARCFYNMYRDLEKQCCNYFLWVLPYNMQRRQHIDPRGFLIADPHRKVNSDLPLRLGCYVNEWSAQIFDALSEDGVLPKEGLLYLQQANGCGYRFLRNASVLFHPYVMDRSITLTASHPHQGPTTTFNNYLLL